MYSLAKKYYETYGNLEIPQHFKTSDGITYDENGLYKLGSWLSTQRQEFTKLLPIRKQKLEQIGYWVNIEKLDEIDSVTKAHIALDIVNNEKNREKLIQDFGHIPNKGEFIETIMNENCPAYVKKETITPKEAAQIIRSANGKVILAHPVAYVHEDNLTEKDILDIVDDMKPDGIEADYIYVDRNNNQIDEIEQWNKFAKLNNLFVTVGSDFHNKDGIRPEIGLVNTNFCLEDKEENEILSNLYK